MRRHKFQSPSGFCSRRRLSSQYEISVKLLEGMLRFLELKPEFSTYKGGRVLRDYYKTEDLERVVEILLNFKKEAKENVNI